VTEDGFIIAFGDGTSILPKIQQLFITKRTEMSAKSDGMV